LLPCFGQFDNEKESMAGTFRGVIWINASVLFRPSLLDQGRLTMFGSRLVMTLLYFSHHDGIS
jgi:hypothetical protein